MIKYKVLKEDLGIPIGTELERRDSDSQPLISYVGHGSWFTTLEIQLALQLGIIEEVKETITTKRYMDEGKHEIGTYTSTSIDGETNLRNPWVISKKLTDALKEGPTHVSWHGEMVEISEVMKELDTPKEIEKLELDSAERNWESADIRDKINELVEAYNILINYNTLLRRINK